ncbi:MAG: putative peptidoglycan glycosyltransferase FtsW [Thermoflexaceae bacterium]|nr:putative peptidoglycan glycosyltransferase FtsW [Thermoflexaceae bacterium]
MKKTKTKVRYYDYSLKFIIYFLLIFGLIILYSTSSYNGRLKTGDPAFYLKRQMLNTIIGIVCMEIVSRIDYRRWKVFALYGYVAAIIMTLLVAFSPLGVTLNGARRWLGIGNYSFQPAEFAKIALIIFLAAFVCELGKNIKRIKSLGAIMVLTGILGLCVYLFTDNLSTGIIIIGIGIVVAFVAYPEYKPFLIGALIGTVLIGIFLFVVFNFVELTDDTAFRLKRIFAWRNPENYTSDIGYQTLQALYAIGSGGLFGKGLGNSIQKLGFIPEAQNDMIFSIICEELGLFGAISIIFVFGLMLWRFMIIANNAPDLYGSLIMVGIMAHIAIQVILNIAVVTNVIPNTGITLPFISYGGTSVIFLLAEMGLALNISSKMRI